MKNIMIIGSSFSLNGSGVPSMNSVFYESISNRIDVEKVDILMESSEKFPRLNPIISRNLYLLAIKKKITGRNIHVMHTIDLCSTFPLMDLSRYAKNKVITVHDFYPFYNKPNNTFISLLDGLLKRRCYNYLKSYNHIFVRTEEISSKLVNNYKIDANKISVQGPIIGYEYSNKYVGTKKKKAIIGYINNFSWNKTPMLKYFIEIFKSIQSREIEFHIYGKNFPFQGLIDDDHRIKYYGFLKDDKLPETLAGFSVYLSTSTVEGFSIPIAKAKAMMVPVLSYNGELPEITKRNTLLWNKTNLRDIILNEMWNTIDLKKAYNDITNLRPENIVDQTVNIYRKVFS